MWSYLRQNNQILSYHFNSDFGLVQNDLDMDQKYKSNIKKSFLDLSKPMGYKNLDLSWNNLDLFKIVLEIE